MKRLSLSLLCSLLLPSLTWATTDSISTEAAAIDTAVHAKSLSQTSSSGMPLLRHTALSTVPMIMVALPYTISNKYVRDQRNSYLSSFHNRYDDYLQFAPLALQLGMHAGGVRGYSTSTGQLLSSDAIGTAIMMTSVTLGKQLTRVMRPDGSEANSFPSGHTAMAFLSATALHLEYGQRYPLVSLAGYLMATGVGVGRMINNRHWIGDVMVGAGVGIASAELGYWLSGLLYRRPHVYREYPCYFASTDLRIYLPWSMGLKSTIHTATMGLGLRWNYSGRDFVLAEGLLEGASVHGRDGEHIFTRNQRLRLGWGRSFNVGAGLISVDASLGINYSTRGELFPSCQLAPRLQLSKRLGWVVQTSYEYRPKSHAIYTSEEVLWYKPAQWRIGSALEMRL